MNSQPTSSRIGLSVFRNWISLSGLVILAGSIFAFVLLFALDFFAPNSNPYVGLLAYLIVPAFFMAGACLAAWGWFLQRRRAARSEAGVPVPFLTIDLSRPRDRHRLAFFSAGSLLFLLFVTVASYRSYHFTESRQFCGQACHEVMNPEFTTYLHSPHARVSCSECHIGPGAAWYVKAKISGLHQVYATAFNKFPRPIKTPIRNLRPAQETCEQCHWPQKFVGNLDRTYMHFLADETNTPYSVRLSLKVGGADPTHGPVGGIHWHMNVANKTEYVATDEQRQVIPWVRVVDPQGIVTEYQTPGFKLDPKQHVIRRMDCMDCHNRPAHIFQNPNKAVNLALALARIDPAIPGIKKEAVRILTRSYATAEEAMQRIATALHDKYPGDPRLKVTIDEVQKIYRDNFFPEMKVDWKVYPDNIGHKDWAGCFRCHDGQHKTPDGKGSIKANDCNACHIILAQGKGAQLEKLNPQGQAFEHPGGDYGDMKCNECHTGGSE